MYSLQLQIEQLMNDLSNESMEVNLYLVCYCMLFSI